ncbi:WXG100 family type VII secretion target [Streptomyces sp. NPDC058989]|uniref:WXG100 family type VII secretion target n=1 Tax=Streptomyces sp. NPDC058989 TaxID=3346686 RepID=UPI00369AE8D3
MSAKDSEFKPAEVHVPKKPDPAPKGSGAASEESYEVGQSRPQFTNLRLNQVKALVEGADPGEVGNVAEGWKKVRVSLVGDDWNSGIKKKFDDAVTKVLQSWHGQSADQFATSAQKISNNFAKLAAYPHNTGYVLEQISDRLKEVKKAVEAVEEPSWLERKADRLRDLANSDTGKAGAIGSMLPGGSVIVGGAAKLMGAGDGRDDSGLNSDLANPKNSIYDAMNKNRGNLSIDRERELEAAHYMEQLATTYRSGVTAIGKPPLGGGGQPRRQEEVPDYDGPNMPIPPIAPYGPPPSGPKGGTSMPKMPGVTGGGYQTPPAMEAPRPNGIDGGIGSIPKTPAPHVGTGLDGLSGGTGLGTSGIGGGGGGGVGTGGLGAGAGGPHGGSGSGIGTPGMPGMVGGAGGARGGGAGGVRGGGAGAGAGARGARAGMPGMAGAAGAGAKGGAKGAGAGKGGALARQKGGIIGGKAGKAGGGTQGGSGLHRSRGGSQQGAAGGRRPAGMMGGPGAHGAKGKDKANENGQRPDYLVEDEETWTPERNVAPKVIE